MLAGEERNQSVSQDQVQQVTTSRLRSISVVIGSRTMSFVGGRSPSFRFMFFLL